MNQADAKGPQQRAARGEWRQRAGGKGVLAMEFGGCTIVCTAIFMRTLMDVRMAMRPTVMSVRMRMYDERFRSGRPSSEEAHAHGHPHIHQDANHAPAAAISLKSLCALGITGGIVPCPAALVVLLGALAIHRIAFGLFLIVAFSAGLAAVLIGFGLAMVYARRFMSRFAARGPLTERWLPLASSAVITVVGITIALQSLAAVGVLRI